MVETPDVLVTFQGGVYVIGSQVGQFTRVASFEGDATVQNSSSGQIIQLVPHQAVVASVDSETITPPHSVDETERSEVDEWDVLAFEIHQENGQRYMFSGNTANMARLAANDNKRSQRVAANQNKQRAMAQAESQMAVIKKAFIQFCIDTGRPPSTSENFKALVYNPGLSTWRGPYLKGEVPPKDYWGSPIRYKLMHDASTGEEYGEIISAGPNRLNSGGSTDDLKVLVPFQRYIN